MICEQYGLDGYEDCEGEFAPTGRNHKYCSPCVKTRERKRGTERYENPQYRERKQEYQRAHLRNNMLNQARYRAKQSQSDFTITLDDIVVPEFCPYLGIKLEQARGKGPRYGSPTLDRIDNSKGYVAGNVEVISYRMNALKRDLTLREMELVGKAYLERVKKCQ